jgi:GT2 family glycosyltransferase
MLSLSIVIPTYNGRKHLERCLPSVCHHAPAGTQIIVVDDASTDGTAAWITRAFPRVELLAQSTNQGFVGAVNEGIRQARGTIIELLNNDTEVAAGWTAHSLRWFDDPAVGSVAPLVLQMEKPNLIDSAGTDYHLCGWAYNRGFNREFGPEFEQPCEVFGPSGSAGFYRRAALEKTGVLLPELGAYFEDIDLAFRLRWAGYRCMYEPGARVLHRGSASYGQKNPRVTRLIARNEEIVYWMNLPERELMLGLLAHLGFLGVRLLRKLADGGIGPFLAGKYEALLGWHNIVKRRAELKRLVRTGTVPVDLHLAHGVNVIGRGVNWLRRRQCA